MEKNELQNPSFLRESPKKVTIGPPIWSAIRVPFIFLTIFVPLKKSKGTFEHPFLTLEIALASQKTLELEIIGASNHEFLLFHKDVPKKHNVENIRCWNQEKRNHIGSSHSQSWSLFFWNPTSFRSAQSHQGALQRWRCMVARLRSGFRILISEDALRKSGAAPTVSPYLPGK